MSFLEDWDFMCAEQIMELQGPDFLNLEVGQFDMNFDVLLNLEDADFSSIDGGEESDEDEVSDLEEGEYKIPDDFTPWKSDDEVASDDEDSIDEYDVVGTSKTSVFVKTRRGERREVTYDFIPSYFSEEELRSQKDAALNEELTKLWHKEIEEKKKPKRITQRENPTRSQPTGGICAWFWDPSVNSYVIKRYDGIQYLRPQFKYFNTLPRLEVQDLARMGCTYLGGEPTAWMRFMTEQIIKEGRSRKWKMIQPRRGKEFIDHKKIDKDTMRIWRRKLYKKVVCRKRIPMKEMPQDILGKAAVWGVDPITGEAVVYEYDDQDPPQLREILRIYDPRHLYNLSRADLLILDSLRIQYTEGWVFESQKYRRVVRFCVKEGYHAGCDHYN